MNDFVMNASITTPEISACTYPQGPRGIGIKSITQDKNNIIITFDDGATQNLKFPDWWFGSIEEYNSLTSVQKREYSFFFIREET